MSTNKPTAVADEKLAELRAKHGTVYTFARDEETFVFRKARPVEYRKYIGTVSADRSAIFDASDALVRACVVYPEGAALEHVLEEWPGLVIEVGAEIAAVASKSSRAEAKKA